MKKLIPISTQRRILRDVTNSDKTINFNKLALVLDSLEYDTKHCIHKRKLYWFKSWVQIKNNEFNKRFKHLENANWFINSLNQASKLLFNKEII
tara:strand:- start:6280 stop:6561 length:282 start_codon:yes stop_codon:yes gene_type:complete